LTRRLDTIVQGRVPERQATSLSGLIRASVEAALNGAPVRCEYAVAENLWPAEVDARQIGQALRNVALNAREAMPRGGVLAVGAENLRLHTLGDQALPPGAYVRISITDSGGGISQEVLPKIFDAYYSTKERGEQPGLGLGLTLSQAVVQKHGGAIVVESAVGVGTTFHLYLPATPTTEDRGPKMEDRGGRGKNG
jgi:signal transduction histidine kinase